MSKVEFSHHAYRMLDERGIKREWVDEAVRNPTLVEADRVFSDLEHRLLRIETFGNRVLRVVVKHGAPELVVTAFFDRSRRNDSRL